MQTHVLLTRLFYLALGAVSSLAFTLLLYWGLLLNSSIGQLIENTYDRPLYFWSYAILTLAAIFLFGVNFALLVYRWRRFGPPRFQAQSGTSAGALFGLVASACPVCGSFFLSLAGITGGLAAFPLGGLELKAASVAFFLLPVWLIWRDIKGGACAKDGVCPIPRDASFGHPDKPRLILTTSGIIALVIMGLSMFLSDPVSAKFFPENDRIVVGTGLCKEVRF